MHEPKQERVHANQIRPLVHRPRLIIRCQRLGCNRFLIFAANRTFADFEEEVARGFPVVLVAEDDVTLRNLLLVVLEGQGYAVLVAVDGKDAIELSRTFEGEIKVLLTDMEMPRTGGDELGELIMRERPGIRILKMSGRIAEFFMGRNLSLAFFQKPFIASVVIGKLSEVLAAPAGTARIPT